MTSLYASDDIAALQRENSALRSKVKELEERVTFLTTHAALRAGIVGEQLISQIVDGVRTSYAAQHDIVGKDGSRIEVKYARLNCADPGATSTKRWPWGKIFGEGGDKDYDFLVLIGERDERYARLYKDPLSPFVLFVLPFANIEPFTMSMNGGRYRAIQLSSNPSSARLGHRAKRLFTEFQVTPAELSSRFGL